jgi:acetyl esterase/lipase
MLEVLWAACLLGIANLSAQVPSSVTTVAVDQNLGITTLPLWSGSAGGKNSEASSLTVFVPQSGRGNGTAVVIAPGGAYRGLASNLEGRQVADWFTARGVTAFVLKYRLGQDNPYPAPLLDAQRAVRLVRSVAKTYKLSPERIGIMGFSAGGHLAAMEATSFDTGKHDYSDPVEGLSDRPDFLILGYPWLNAMQPNSKHLITYCSVLSAMPASQCKEWEEKYTPALHVSPKTPPAFIYHTTDDAVVPVQTSIEFYSALLNAGVPAELHVFRHGAHGSGLGTGDEALDLWPELLEMWMRGQGWLSAPAQ